jgi:hypothetical protein
MALKRIDRFIVLATPLTLNGRRLISDLAIKHGLPSIDPYQTLPATSRI